MAECTDNHKRGEGETDLSVSYLKEILSSTVEQNKQTSKPNKVPAGAKPSTWMFVTRNLNFVTPVNRFDEVYPGIFIGDQQFARDKLLLKKIGITHILNAAQGEKFSQIDTNQAYYDDIGLKFMGIKAMDIRKFKMAPHFHTAAEFIHEAKAENGRIAVHCHQGMSRSASLVLAYLMIHQDLNLVDAIRTVIQNRRIFPNDGFLNQLIELQNELSEKTLPSSKENNAS